jgi:CheY-like chemotaxis protein
LLSLRVVAYRLLLLRPVRVEVALSGADRVYRIIVADDDDEMGASMCELLSQLSATVEGASSGGDLGILLAARQPADLLITDVRMPWLNGLQVATAARNAGLRIPVIVVTAFPDDEVRSKNEALLTLVRERLAESG